MLGIVWLIFLLFVLLEEDVLLSEVLSWSIPRLVFVLRVFSSFGLAVLFPDGLSVILPSVFCTYYLNYATHTVHIE